MKVRDVMQRRVATIGEDEGLAVALQLMLWREIRHLPVVREGRVVGVLSERDILRARGEPGMGMGAKVKDAMRAPVEHIHPNAELADAAADMSSKKIGCLPVIETGELVGILTVTDVLGNVAQYPVPRPRNDLRAQDLMSHEPSTVEVDDLLVDAAAKMNERGVRHLCVVDGDLHPVGMLSDRDIRTQIGNLVVADGEVPQGARLSTLRVAHAMTEGVRVAVLDTSLADLVNIFLVEHIGAVPVVDGENRVEGVVSYLDVLRAMAAGVAE